MKNSALLSLTLIIALGLSSCASNSKSLPDPPQGTTDSKDSTPSDKKGVTGGKAEAPRFSDTLKNMDGDKKREKADPYALITCSNADEVRTLAVATKEGGCEVVYEKNGKLNVPAYTAHGTQHCFNSREKIKDRLVSAGWKCQQ
jgi:hypothetical protein